jgi:hypothetical protein
MQFLEHAIWPAVQVHAAYCHDSVSCLDWAGAHPFPVRRIGTEHLGQVFDAFGNARDEDIQLLLEHRPLAECTVALNRTGNQIKMRSQNVVVEGRTVAKETADSNKPVVDSHAVSSVDTKRVPAHVGNVQHLNSDVGKHHSENVELPSVDRNKVAVSSAKAAR